MLRTLATLVSADGIGKPPTSCAHKRQLKLFGDRHIAENVRQLIINVRIFVGHMVSISFVFMHILDLLVIF